MSSAFDLGQDGIHRLVLAGIVDVLEALGGGARCGRHAQHCRRLAQQPWLLAVSLGIAIEETLESSFYLAVLRRTYPRRTGPGSAGAAPPEAVPSGLRRRPDGRRRRVLALATGAVLGAVPLAACEIGGSKSGGQSGGGPKY